MKLVAAAVLLLLLSAWTQDVAAASAADWRSRSIYQVMTDRYAQTDSSTTTSCDPALGVYCGGTWQGITNNLDYIQNMGFTAIWISPITANLPQHTADLSAYHGYWQQNMYDVNSNFGTAADLQALSKALHDRGMFLMVDVVVNDFAWAGDPSSIQYDRLIPFNTASYYHPYCNITATNASVTECWLGDDVIALPDLRTEDSDVINTFKTWISTLVSTYNIDGLRIDSAGNVNKEFFTPFIQAATVFATGEVYSGVPAYVCPYQTTLDSTLNYPIYFPLIRAFSSPTGSMGELVDEIQLVQQTCKDPTLMTVFSENHDQPRFASLTKDLNLAKNVLAFNMLADGIPIVYQGQEQRYSGNQNPLNREAVWLSDYNKTAPLYTYISSLNVLRAHFTTISKDYLTTNNVVIYSNNSTLAMRKGIDGSQVVTVLSNDGIIGASRTILLSSLNSTGFAAGDIVTDVISCVNSTVDSKGNLQVTIKGGMPSVFYKSVNLAGTAICLDGNTTNPLVYNQDPPHKNGADGQWGGAPQIMGWGLATLAALLGAGWL